MHRFHRYSPCLLALGLSLQSAQSAPLLSPQEAVKKMTAPPGFSVDLLAAEPDIVQPIAFCWDSRGRLWVVEGNTYPQRNGTAPQSATSTPSEAQLKDIYGGKDRILIFEDADHNGSFETRKVFMEGLNLVSGIEVGFGGVYVGAAPYLLHIPFKAGEDKPSGSPEILLDGWGYQDTHETLNSFNWGPDGWLYGCHGVFTHSAVGAPGTPADQRTKLNCAYWRYHPLQKKFDIFAHGTSNSWGFDYNAQGEWFSEACVIPHFWHIIQGAYYLRQSNPLGHFNPYVYTNIETIADHQHFVGANPHGGNGVSDEAGGGHAHCGLCIYDGDNFPGEYRGRAMMFNIHGQRINQENLVPTGSGFVAKHLPDFVKANDPNFTGVALKVGPDGAVYFIDWYDKQKCHRPGPEEWDRRNGRLYRVKFDATWKAYSGEDVANATDARLDEFLCHTNVWQRRMARRISMERPMEAQEEAKLIAEAPPGTIRTERLFRYISKGGQFDDSLAKLVNDTDPAFRASIARIAPGVEDDSNARVRLAILSKLTQLPVAARWSGLEKLSLHAEDATDHNIPQMIWFALEPCVPIDPARALKLAQASCIPLVTANTARRLAEMDGGLAQLIDGLANEKSSEIMKLLLPAAVAGLRGQAAVNAPAAWEKAYAVIGDLAETAKAPELLDLRLSLAMAFGDARAYPPLRQLVTDATKPAERRQAAWRSLVTGRYPELMQLLPKLLNDPTLRLEALKAIPQAVAKAETADVTGLANNILGNYAKWTTVEKQAAAAGLASQALTATALLEAIRDAAVPRSDISSFVARQIVNLRQPALTEMLEKVWGRVNTDAATTASAAEEVAKWQKVLTPVFLKKASRSTGRELFKSVCATCHTLYGEGGKIGPDLTGSNRADLAYLLENIANPNAILGQDYELHVFALKNGQSVAGMIRNETDVAFTVQTLVNEEIVSKTNITEHSKPGISMMPPGVLTALQPEQVRDLLSYLSHNEQVPLPGEKGADSIYRVPGVLEGETMKVLTAGVNIAPQDMRGYKDGQWSGGHQLWWTGGKPGSKLTLSFPVETAEKYLIEAVLTRAVDYAVVSFQLDGKPLGDKSIDLFGSKVSNTSVNLGETTLKAGEHQLTIEVTGANPQAVKSYMFGLDYIRLVPQK